MQKTWFFNSLVGAPHEDNDFVTFGPKKCAQKFAIFSTLAIGFCAIAIVRPQWPRRHQVKNILAHKISKKTQKMRKNMRFHSFRLHHIGRFPRGPPVFAIRIQQWMETSSFLTLCSDFVEFVIVRSDLSRQHRLMKIFAWAWWLGGRGKGVMGRRQGGPLYNLTPDRPPRGNYWYYDYNSNYNIIIIFEL